ncbi:hypothetical protein DFH11DRAFT_1879290 [Phellopilus nigrolimitatus]|nr:hypothetical protein DFH11DRAFT_1879290 [Phellopilus nigrolimitatus]
MPNAEQVNLVLDFVSRVVFSTPCKFLSAYLGSRQIRGVCTISSLPLHQLKLSLLSKLTQSMQLACRSPVLSAYAPQTTPNPRLSDTFSDATLSLCVLHLNLPVSSAAERQSIAARAYRLTVDSRMQAGAAWAWKALQDETITAALTDNDVGPGRRRRAKARRVELERHLFVSRLRVLPTFEGTKKPLRLGTVGATLSFNSGRPSIRHGDETSGTPKPFAATQCVAPFASTEPYEQHATSDTSAAYSWRAASRRSLGRKLVVPSSSVCGM